MAGEAHAEQRTEYLDENKSETEMEREREDCTEE